MVINDNSEPNNTGWSSMTHEQKNHELFLKQKALLDQFLETGAISREQNE